MRTPLLVGIVVAAHCVAVGSVILIQGCGTVVKPLVGPDDSEIVLPPTRDDTFAPRRSQPIRQKRSVARTRPSAATTYTVERGDSLSQIAKRFGVTVAEIMALNNIRNKNVIVAGQRLLIPAARPSTARRATRRKTMALPSSLSGSPYVVQPGDCLSGIAIRFGTTVGAIKDANGLGSDLIRVGRKLVVPGGDSSKTSARGGERGAVPDGKKQEGAAVSPPASLAPFRAPVASGRPNIVDSQPVRRSTGLPLHTVQQREDLRGIAMAYGTSEAAIRLLNGLGRTERVRPGQELRIPE